MAHLGNLEREVGRFEAMVKMPNFADRQAALARIVDGIFDQATARKFKNGKGFEYDNPDFGAQVKCAELAGRLAAIFVQAEKVATEDGRDMTELELERLFGYLRRMGYTIKKAA